MQTQRPLSTRAAAFASALGLFGSSSCGGGGSDAAPPVEPLAVTVRVVGLTALDQLQAEPVAGALVTLEHPMGVATGTTGPDGRALFFDLPAPYTATAQLDWLVPGTQDAETAGKVVRLASSVRLTRAARIGLPIFFSEVRADGGAPDSLLRVVVDDRPESGALWTRVEESDGARADFDSGWIPLAATSSTQAAVDVEVPADVRFGLVVAHFPAGFPPVFGGLPATAIVVDAAVPPVAAGATGERGFSWSGPDRIDIDQPITLDVDGGAEIAQLHEITLDLRSKSTSYTASVAVHRQEFAIDGFPDDLPLLVADPAHPLLADFVYAIRPREEVTFFGVETKHEVEWFPPCVLPNFHAVLLSTRPMLVQPMPNTFLSPEDAEELGVNATDLGEFGVAGYTLTRLASDSPAHDVDGFRWWIHTGPGTSGLRVPRPTLPMFGGGTEWTLTVGKERRDGGAVFAFETLFGEELGPSLIEAQVPQEPCGSFEWLRASARTGFSLTGGAPEGGGEEQ